ncbi:hypothetical protein Tco_0272044 [Tanacetum coccineum]
MKGYVEKLERLGYVLPQDITIGLILNGLTKDFVGFVRNYNMHNMGKTIGEIHAMLIEYKKGLPKKAKTPQVMMIKGGKIQKANKKSFNAKCQNKVKGKGKDKKVYIPKPKNPKPTAMEHPAKDDASPLETALCLDIGAIYDEFCTTGLYPFWDYALESRNTLLSYGSNKEEVVEHSFGDHGEPANLKLLLLDPESKGEAAFILGIKIYKNRSKRLIGLSQNAYMDKILKRYKMDNSKRGTILMQERLDLNKSQGAQTPKEVNRMKNVPYASAVGSIIYVLGLSGNPSTELRVECYCDTGFETDRDDTGEVQKDMVFVLNGERRPWIGRAPSKYQLAMLCYRI